MFAGYTVAMSDEMVIEGKTYISSKRAAQVSGYAQDYIGQLARGGAIDAQRVGGLWFVNLESIQEHQTKSEEEKSEQAKAAVATNRPADPDTFVGLDGKSYISANRASKLSGYNQDYVGQLARSGQIDSRQVGSRWYINQESLLAHKEEKDALLAAVQSDAVGLHMTPDIKKTSVSSRNDPDLMRYFADDKDLIPEMMAETRGEPSDWAEKSLPESRESDSGLDSGPTSVSIRRGPHHPAAHALVLRENRPVSRRSSMVVRKSLLPMVTTLAGAALTIVIVLSFGFTSLKSQSTYASSSTQSVGLMGAVANAGESCARAIEVMLTKELHYIRNN